MGVYNKAWEKTFQEERAASALGVRHADALGSFSEKQTVRRIGMKRWLRNLLVVFLALLLLGGGVLWRGLWEMSHPELTNLEITSDALPSSFDGFCVLQVSDLHGAFLQNDALWDEALAQKPDLIAITGDVVSRGATDEEIGKVAALVARLCEVAPVYYVGGNHEAQGELLWERTSTALIEKGAVKLSDECVLLERDGQTVNLIGLRDPFRRQSPSMVKMSFRRQTELALSELTGELEGFSLLLAHRPEDVDLYANAGIDVALTGHTHGGQIRLPFLGAVFAPMQGFFPAYSAGLYQVQETQMYVSRGLGGGFRFLCRPELNLVTLRCA